MPNPPRDATIKTDATTPARAAAGKPYVQSTFPGRMILGSVADGIVLGTLASETGAGEKAGSGTVTRIKGAPHSGQKTLPCGSEA
jgi:hypothetical protein